MRRANNKYRYSFMSPGEFTRIRIVVLQRFQHQLVEALIDPDNGEPIDKTTISAWEHGRRPIPLWAARRMRALEEAAVQVDKEGDTDEKVEQQ